ncbi:hypothetical protein DRQ36_07215 [bacterium]|nr:MAG: hypothetical protein DRQ36_07215 [bacterium]
MSRISVVGETKKGSGTIEITIVIVGIATVVLTWAVYKLNARYIGLNERVQRRYKRLNETSGESIRKGKLPTSNPKRTTARVENFERESDSKGKIRCPNCGRTYPESRTVCPYCGVKPDQQTYSI